MNLYRFMKRLTVSASVLAATSFCGCASDNIKTAAKPDDTAASLAPAEKEKMEYVINKAPQRPSLKGEWDETPWRSANVIPLTNFLPQSKSRHPRVEAKALYQDDGLFIFFRVFDKYVRCVQTQYQAQVCTDSCVEFFVEPKEGRGYFNFEINAGGTLLLYYCVPRPTEPGTKPDKSAPTKRPAFNPVPWEFGHQVAISDFLIRPNSVFCVTTLNSIC